MKPRPALYKVHLWPSDRVQRFLAFIPHGAAGSCWRWQGSHGGKGQGRYRYRESGRQVSVYAARVAWILENGPVPMNREVVHSYLNVDCCNVAHLVLATPAERCSLLPERGRSIAGSRHPSAKVTPAKVRQMRALVAKQPELTGQEIAARFGLTTAWANAIIRGDGWSTIPYPPPTRRKGPRPNAARD